MSSQLTIDLDDKQRETILCGLRYVRSAIMLDIHDPDPDVDAARAGELREIARLVEQLGGVKSKGETADV